MIKTTVWSNVEVVKWLLF